MASAELTSTQAPPIPAARPQTTRSRSLDIVPDGPVHAAARWLRRALADSARAWALAAGVPPDMYH